MSEPVQSVVRAFALLQRLASSAEPVSLADLASRVDLPKSTTRRLLATLEYVDVVARGAERGTYVPGPALAVLAQRVPFSGLAAVATPYLRDVVDLTGEDATLAVVDGGAVIYVAQLGGPNPIQVPDGTGIRFAPHEVSSGLVLMADWPDEHIHAYCRSQVVDEADVWSKLESVRNNGYVWHIDRWVDGISAVAAPVRDGAGQAVAALGAFGPSYRFPGDRDPARLGRDVAALAKRLSELAR